MPDITVSATAAGFCTHTVNMGRVRDQVHLASQAQPTATHSQPYFDPMKLKTLLQCESSIEQLRAFDS